MLRGFTGGLLFLLAAPMALSQKAPAVRVGAGVTAPKLLSKVEPEYSPQARDAGLQGTLLLSIVVSESGKAEEIEVVSPLGFGLDERAIRAVEQWMFAPGMRGSTPVRVYATVQVNFRLGGEYFDPGLEKRRTSFNAAISTLRKPASTEKMIATARATLQRLEKQNYPPAMLAMALAYQEGTWVTRDEARSGSLVEAAAKKNYGPALYELGRRQIRASPSAPESAWKLVRDASVLGSSHAQEFLGDRYASGEGVEKDEERARRYYRLCATSGTPRCQLRLAELLLAKRGGTEFDVLQGYAWATLAAGAGYEPARPLAERAEQLPEDDRKWIATLQRQMKLR